MSMIPNGTTTDVQHNQDKVPYYYPYQQYGQEFLSPPSPYSNSFAYYPLPYLNQRYNNYPLSEPASIIGYSIGVPLWIDQNQPYSSNLPKAPHPHTYTYSGQTNPPNSQPSIHDQYANGTHAQGMEKQESLNMASTIPSISGQTVEKKNNEFAEFFIDDVTYKNSKLPKFSHRHTRR